MSDMGKTQGELMIDAMGRDQAWEAWRHRLYAVAAICVIAVCVKALLW